MTTYDVFNGDADGICALQQLRLASPAESTLVTGVKRDIRLLSRVFPSRGDAVTVLDVSLDSNRDELVRILDAGAEVAYFDHHFAGEVPVHERLETHLSTSRDVCTSLLVDGFLRGRYRAWAIVGAFGDNLDSVASRLGVSMLTEGQLGQLQELGRLLNYNAYGRVVEDLHVAPDELYRRLHPYEDPLDFAAKDGLVGLLKDGFESDMAQAAALEPEVVAERLTVYVLPDEPWSRRVSGVMANDLVRRQPGRTHAVLVPNSSTCYMVSVRVSGDSPVRADEFCRQFDSGGGRPAAGGINHLPRRRLDDFLRMFRKSYS
jgi:DHHA1 domain